MLRHLPSLAPLTRTALSLSVLAAAGCAPFDPNPAATQQAGAPPVAVTASPAATPAGPQAQPQAPAALPAFLLGRAFDGELPVANAPYTVLDALTGEPIAGTRPFPDAPGAELKTEGHGLILFTIPKSYTGRLVRVAVKTPSGAYLNTLLAVTPTATGYRLAAGPSGNCGSNTNVPLANGEENFSVTVGGGPQPPPPPTLSIGNTIVEPGESVTFTGTGFQSEESVTFDLLAAGDSCTKQPSFRLDFTSTLSSGAMSGVLSLMKAGLAGGESVEQMLASAQASSRSIDEGFGKNAASKKAAYEAYTKAPEANAGLGLGVAFKQVESILEAAGVPKNAMATTVAETFSAILKALQANPTGDFQNLVLTADDVPSILELDFDALKTGNISYTDPVTNEVVSVTVGDRPTDPNAVIAEPDVSFEDLDDFLSDATKLAPEVTVNYDADDATSPLRLTVAQAGDTFDVKTITASIPRTYVKAVNLAAASQINDTTTVTDPSGAASGWSTLTGGLPHRVTATSQTASLFTGIWSFGAALPGTKIADVAITATSGAVEVDLTFGLLNNNAIKTKGGKVVMDILKSVIELDTAALDKLDTNSDNVVSIIITSRSGTDADLSPNTADIAAAVNYTRPVVRP